MAHLPRRRPTVRTGFGFPPPLTIFVLVCSGLIGTGVRRTTATPSEQVPVGPRAIAMGSAFSSLALDASALYWNPAGIAWIGHQELAGSYANLYQTDVKDNYAAFVLPISRVHGVGFDWYHSGFDDAELAFSENRFDVSWGMQLRKQLAVGVTTKYLNRDTDLDGSTVSRGSGFGVDIGALATPIRNLRVGVVAQDLTNTSIRYPEGGSSIVYPRNVRVGASYAYANRTTLALDVDDRWHAGIEARPTDLLAVRAGLEADRHSSDGATFTAGLGVTTGIFRFDYAYVVPPVLPPTSHFGVSMAFNFNPAQVRIEKIETNDIFASQYKTYDHVPFGHAVIRNLSNKALDTRLRVEIPGQMDLPTERSLTLRAGAAETIDLFANLNNRPMAALENFRAPVRVTASYKSDRLDRSDHAGSSVVIYAPGAIDWSLGVDQTAAFITSEDPIVDSVATRAARVGTMLARSPLAARNVVNAAAIFDALGALGVVYQPDPNDPYPSISQRVGAVDKVNYPRQTLAKRSGDCDDTTVLLAALYGNLGIATKIVDVPGHLFLLFDTGEHERNRLSLGVDEDLLEVIDDGVWIPVETTALRDGFAAAWRAGAARFALAQSNKSVNLIDVQEAQSRIESQLPVQAVPVPAIDLDATLQRLTADATVLAGWRDEYIRTKFPPSDGPGVSPDARDKLAHVEYLSGQADAAVAVLEAESRADSSSARAHNNLGDAYAARAQFSAAMTEYHRALQADPSDAGILLNCGLVLYTLGDSAGSYASLAQALTRSGSLANACALLGVRVEQPETRSGTRQFTVAQTRALLRGTLGRIARLDSLRTASRLPAAPKTTLKPIRLVTAGPRGDEVEDPDMRNFLYWREIQ